jgi:hypothetical protein
MVLFDEMVVRMRTPPPARGCQHALPPQTARS